MPSDNMPIECYDCDETECNFCCDECKTPMCQECSFIRRSICAEACIERLLCDECAKDCKYCPQIDCTKRCECCNHYICDTCINDPEATMIGQYAPPDAPPKRIYACRHCFDDDPMFSEWRRLLRWDERRAAAAENDNPEPPTPYEITTLDEDPTWGVKRQWRAQKQKQKQWRFFLESNITQNSVLKLVE